MMAYLDTLESAKKRGEALLIDQNGWKTSSKSSEFCKIDYKSSDKLNCSIFRCVMWMKAPAEIIRETFTFLPGSRRKEWDENVSEMTVLKQINDSTLIYCNRTNGMAKGLISPREIIDVAQWLKRDDGGYFIVATSIDYPEIPIDDKYVRGVTGVMILKIEKDPSRPGVMKISSLSEVDLKGKIPKYLLDTAIPGIIASTFVEWKKFLEKQGYSTP